MDKMKSISKQVSIYDIAKKAGVSPITVSRVLNNKSASIKARTRVLNEAKNLGYVPNVRAASLRRSYNKSIGLLIPDISNPVYPIMVKAIHDIARRQGYYLILGNTYGNVEEELEILQRMAQERIAGLVLATGEEDDSPCNPYLMKMIGMGIHVILTGRARNGLKADEVMTASAPGVYRAVNYLLKIGREKVAFLAGKRGLLATEQRFAGYRKALSENGVAPDEKLLSFGEDWSMESGKKQMKDLLKANKIVDAVFCGNDLMAIGAMDTIQKKGLKVPDDIAVIGFDDIELASLVRPRLTTVVQHQEKVASTACSLLLDRIEGRQTGEPKEILIESELTIRESA
ncbi:MAG: LacI family DNA-binding transcriptional regulator [Candidatus Omnitrophota bacterium]